MNDLMKFIHGKKFLETLFPMGLTEPVVIGQICLNVFGNTIISLHTKQQPVVEVAKWGVWGKDYNVVVIKLLGGDDALLEARNWPSKNYLPLDLLIENDRCQLV